MTVDIRIQKYTHLKQTCPKILQKVNHPQKLFLKPSPLGTYPTLLYVPGTQCCEQRHADRQQHLMNGQSPIMSSWLQSCEPVWSDMTPIHCDDSVEGCPVVDSHGQHDLSVRLYPTIRF